MLSRSRGALASSAIRNQEIKIDKSKRGPNDLPGKDYDKLFKSCQRSKSGQSVSKWEAVGLPYPLLPISKPKDLSP
jgi:hypothetical protein